MPTWTGRTELQFRVSARRGKELKRDAVRISEAQTQPIGCVLDPSVGDAKLIESAYPLFEFLPIGTTKCNMVEAEPELAELLVGYRRHVLVQPEELAVTDQVHRVMEVGIGVLVKHGLGTQ